jgi:hypothetical protein
MACQGQTLKRIGSLCKLGRKWTVANTAPGACTIKLITAVNYGFS